jgi:hypothetical protein
VQDFKAVVAVECQPEAVDHWLAICNKHDIILTWPHKYDETLNELLAEVFDKG